MNNDSQIAEEAGRVFALALPFMPFWYLLGSTGLKDTNLAWFIAVLILLGFECGIMIMDWINPKRTSSDIPNIWFERLAHAVARAGLVVYLAVAVFRADSSYFALLRTAMAHSNFSSSAVWVPCLTGAVLLANAAYAIPMGVRYRVGPNQRADRISTALSAVLWMAGAAALLWLDSFTPQPFVGERLAVAALHYLFASLLLWPDDPAAAHFVVTWLYLGVILRNGVKLAMVLRGNGGAARERAREQEQVEAERGAWPTGD